MRRFFSRTRNPSHTPEVLARALTAGDRAERIAALREASALSAERLGHPALQKALEQTAGQEQDQQLLQQLLPLIASGPVLERLVVTKESHALAWLQVRPDPSQWPAPLRSLSVLKLQRLRQCVLECPTATDAQTLLDSADCQELAATDRLALWLSRRDLQGLLWSLPEAATAEGLQQIERVSRNKDKRTNREARQRLQQLKADQRAAASTAQRAQELKQAVERLNQQLRLQGVRTAGDTAIHAALLHDWHTLGLDPSQFPTLTTTVPHEAELKAPASTTRDIATTTITVTEAAAPARDTADSDSAVPTLFAEVSGEHTGAANVRAVAVEAGTDSGEADTVAPGDAAQAELPERLKDYEAVLGALEQAIKNGSTRTANAVMQQLRQLDKPPLPLSKTLRQRSSKAQATMREWGSWQTFATAPKRAELVSAMQQAAEAPLDPGPQAKRIKALRNQWRELGPPRGSAERELAKTFDTAAETAFTPCRSYFAEQAEQQAENARARAALCDALTQYLTDTDWSKADFKAAEQILKQARQDWRNHHPVPRKGEAALRDRFEQLQAQLHDRLKQHWAHQRAAKEALVQRADALANSTAPLGERITQAKRLQSEWQHTGRLPRREEQALWTAFRGGLDQVFSTREAEQAANEQARRATLEGIDQALSILADSRDAPTANALRTCLETVATLLTGLPQRDAEQQQRRMDSSEKDYRAALREARTRERLQRIVTLLDWDERASSAPGTLPKEAPASLQAAVDATATIETLRTFVLRCELRAGIDSPAADREQRMQLKLNALQAGQRNQDDFDGYSAEELALAWCALGPKLDPAAAALRVRLREALRELA